MPLERVDFPNGRGQQLAGLLDLPAGDATCLRVVCALLHLRQGYPCRPRIAEALTALGIAVVRFDFTGLGASEGEFANTTFSSNVADLIAAADHLRATAWRRRS